MSTFSRRPIAAIAPLPMLSLISDWKVRQVLSLNDEYAGLSTVRVTWVMAISVLYDRVGKKIVIELCPYQQVYTVNIQTAYHAFRRYVGDPAFVYTELSPRRC